VLPIYFQSFACREPKKVEKTDLQLEIGQSSLVLMNSDVDDVDQSNIDRSYFKGPLILFVILGMI